MVPVIQFQIINEAVLLKKNGLFPPKKWTMPRLEKNVYSQNQAGITKREKRSRQDSQHCEETRRAHAERNRLSSTEEKFGDFSSTTGIRQTPSSEVTHVFTKFWT